jgi:hypothetical protein
MSLTDLCFQPGITQKGLTKVTACFSNDCWSPERGLTPEPPAEKHKFHPFDRPVSLRMWKTNTNLHYTKRIADRLPEHTEIRVPTEKVKRPSIMSFFFEP